MFSPANSGPSGENCRRYARSACAITIPAFDDPSSRPLKAHFPVGRFAAGKRAFSALHISLLRWSGHPEGHEHRDLIVVLRVCTCLLRNGGKPHTIRTVLLGGDWDFALDRHSAGRR